MAPPSRHVRVAAALALSASFLWATYYYFVLSLSSGSRPPSVVAYPFLVAGAVLAGYAIRRGHAAQFLAVWRSPAAYLRAGLLAGMQIAVLAGTYAAGPVDTSLLSLVGDVCLTPVLLMWIYREGRDRAKTPTFLGGISLSTVGAALTIVGGSGATLITGWAWLVAPAIPFTVAFYFLLTARVNREIPTAAVVAQASLAAGLLSIALSPLLPGGAAGLVVPSWSDAALLVGLGLGSFVIAPMLYFVAIERAGLLLPALLMATIPLFTVLVEFVAFRVVPSDIALLGVPIAVVGGFLSVQGSHPGWTPSYASAGERTAK